MSTDTPPNTKKITVAHTVPRDPGAYEATIHFGQRLRERVPKKHRDLVVRRCIEQGICLGVSDPEDTDRDDVRQFFAFDYADDVLGTEYRLIVGIRPIAIKEQDRKHLAVTIMEKHDN